MEEHLYDRLLIFIPQYVYVGYHLQTSKNSCGIKEIREISTGEIELDKFNFEHSLFNFLMQSL
jgi:hypothetical protein